MTEAKCLRSVGKGAPRRSPDGSRSARPAATRAAEDLSIIAKGAMSYFPRPAPFDAAVHPPTVAGLRCWQRALPPSHGKTSRSSWPKIRSPWFGDQLGECLADHSRAPARRCWLTASLLSWRPFSALASSLRGSSRRWRALSQGPTGETARDTRFSLPS